MPRRPTRSRHAITLSEVVVLLVLACLTISLLLPALLRGRAQSRINRCDARLNGLIRAVQEFESMTGAYPSGSVNETGPILNEPIGLHHSWIVQLLPFIDETAKPGDVDPSISVYDGKYRSLRHSVLPAIACPASPPPKRDVLQHSSYAASYHDSEVPIDTNNNGAFFLNSRITQPDIPDGLEYTMFLGEVQLQAAETSLGWMSGTRATLRNTGSTPSQKLLANSPVDDKLFVGSFGSWHSALSHVAMGDGRVTAISSSIDPIAFRQLGNRSDGSKLKDGEASDE